MDNLHPDESTEDLSPAPSGEGAVAQEWCEGFIDPAIRLVERLARVLADRTFNSVDFPYLSQWAQNRKGPIADLVFETFPDVRDAYLSILEDLPGLQAKFGALQMDVASSQELERGLRTVLLIKAPKPASQTAKFEPAARTLLSEMFDRLRKGDEKFHNTVAQRVCQHLIGIRSGRASGNEGFIDTQIVPFVLPGFKGRHDILATADELRSSVEASHQRCTDFHHRLEELRQRLCHTPND